jgi:hypothetical protein
MPEKDVGRQVVITDPQHVGEGWIDLTLNSGGTYHVMVLVNDPASRLFRVEKEDGFRLEIAYGAFHSARRWDDQKPH